MRLTTCLVAISASLSALRSSYCARGLCSSPATPPSSAPVYQSRSSLTCSSSHSLASSPKAPSSPSGLPPLAALGVGASQPRFFAPPHPTPTSLERGVESQPTLGTRTLGASRELELRTLRGVESQLRTCSCSVSLSWPLFPAQPLSPSRFSRRWKSPKPLGASRRGKLAEVMPSK